MRELVSIKEKALAFLQKYKWSLANFLALSFYAGITCFIMGYHERWYDEAGPWLIARDADWPTFLKIVFQNYDRHPALLYLILFPFAKLGFPYATLSFLNWGICVLSVSCFLKKAPLPWLVKSLFVFSFYMFYEYVVISRPYGLAILWIFLLAGFYAQRLQRPILYASLIALLFNTEYLCFAFALALGALFVYDILKLRPVSKKQIIALVILASGGLLAFGVGHQLPMDHSELGNSIPFQIRNIFSAIEKAFVPFELIFHGFFGKVVVPPILTACIAWATLSAALLSLINKPRLLLLFAFGTSELFYIFTSIQIGDLRHYGFILIFLMFVLWIQIYESDWDMALSSFASQSRRVAFWLLGFCFVLGIRFSVYAYQLDYYLQFSGSKKIADNIQELFKKNPALKDAFIVEKDMSTASVMAYLPGIKFWNPCLGDFLKVNYAYKELSDCNQISHQEMVQKTYEKLGRLERLFFLVAKPFEIKELNGYQFNLVAKANEYVFGYNYENYYLYFATRKSS